MMSSLQLQYPPQPHNLIRKLSKSLIYVGMPSQKYAQPLEVLDSLLCLVLAKSEHGFVWLSNYESRNCINNKNYSLKLIVLLFPHPQGRILVKLLSLLCYRYIHMYLYILCVCVRK